jgi:hypothetical protein
MNDQDLDEVHSDDQSVLNFLLEHVRGIRPVSTTDELVLDDDIEFS